MQYFSTEFPLRRHTSREELLAECLNWISDSPYTSFTQEELTSQKSKPDFRVSNKSETIDFDSATSERYQVFSLKYTKRSETVQYVTTISFLIMNTSEEVWASVKSICEYIGIVNELPPIKKPVIIIRLIDRFGGGLDGDLLVSHEPTLLSEDENGRELAINTSLGNLETRLPIVYVSCGYDLKHRVIPDRLARSLCGLAHVIVEPSRKFSHTIRKPCNSQNVFGGVIGVYWPGGQGVKTYRYDKNWTPKVKDFELEILSDICALLSKRMPLAECSWGGVKDAKNKAAIERLRKEGASDREMLELYENEVERNKCQIEELGKEKSRLESLIRSSQNRNPVQGGIVISGGDEEDYYQNEILGVIIDALCEYRQRVHENSRRLHIIDSLLKSNTADRNHEQISREIKDGLRGYKSMTPKIRSLLERHGFQINDDRRHYKIVYKSDERYSYILPKSGSDYRGGLNAGSDIVKIIF